MREMKSVSARSRKSSPLTLSIAWRGEKTVGIVSVAGVESRTEDWLLDRRGAGVGWLDTAGIQGVQGQQPVHDEVVKRLGHRHVVVKLGSHLQRRLQDFAKQGLLGRRNLAALFPETVYDLVDRQQVIFRQGIPRSQRAE